MYFVYVLRSQKDFKHYIGYTADLKRRLQDHNRGKSQSVRHRGPFELIYQEAIAREIQLKSLKSPTYLKRKLEIKSTLSSSLV